MSGLDLRSVAASYMLGARWESANGRNCKSIPRTLATSPCLCGTARAEELIALGEQKGAAFWKAGGIVVRGCLLTLTKQPEAAIQTINAGINFWRSAGASVTLPLSLPYFATAYANLGQFDDAWRTIREALTIVETTKERWGEAEVQRIAGEIALKPQQPDAAKAEGYFERALAVARQQQAKSWELRAAMSLARLWRDQRKLQASTRNAGSGLRLVYGRLRHARSEGGEGVAGRAWRLSTII